MVYKRSLILANRLFSSQFLYNFERQLVSLQAAITQSGSVGAFATLVTQGITLTAVRMGSAGNSITIAFTGGATAGAEVVSVSNKAISVQIESGVSSITQVRTAINASAAAAALVAATGTSASAVSSASALPLASGADTSFSQIGSGFSIAQSGTGVYELTLENTYSNLLGIDVMIQKATAADLKPQMISQTVSSSKLVNFRILAVATPTNLASGDVMYITLKLRNSANRSSSTP